MNPRKKQIIDVAHRLFIEKGFSATSIKDILTEADIAKGTFYNHFASKNECLMAILEMVRNKARRVREELSFGKPKDDPDIFVQQVLVRMELDREQNLLPLFESIYSSKDQDLKNFMKKQHKAELQWVALRLVDLFGEQTKEYSIDYACMFFGMVHQMMHVWKLGSAKEYDLKEMVYFIIKQLRSLITNQSKEDKPFFPADWLYPAEKDILITPADIKKQLVTQLGMLLNRMEERTERQSRTEWFEFLHTELQEDSPRDFLIESVLFSIEDKSDSSFYKNEIQEIIQLGHQYLHYKRD
ncbi:TetR/AcrR family transcriptional regulator [Lederbergia sp. NSJ-179]|uniref:TetR/AcrR family transcriptional regulator n=1 Tax=Lederbergia sp. NSJ-179 TaxID=2931402 RepID=UPI001FD4AD20|nr:TetR/AcrR family transcriptional regulator [Lederbergia sp. NSJ-179]MCJ7840458.1 TetR/AcrR family transcriptional regulator [Lederbergia sp. NSJ-179]